MPPSKHKPVEIAGRGQELAVGAEMLFLLNLLIIPGAAFVLLVILYFATIRRAPPLAACHLRQAFFGSIWAGVAIIVFISIMLWWGDRQQAATWVVVILYFTIVHASFVLVGAMGLAKAMAGQNFRYPLVGRPCHVRPPD